MPGAFEAEIYFIAAMMILIMIMSIAAVYFFMRQYRKEMREKAVRDKEKAAARAKAAEASKNGA